MRVYLTFSPQMQQLKNQLTNTHPMLMGNPQMLASLQSLLKQQQQQQQSGQQHGQGAPPSQGHGQGQGQGNGAAVNGQGSGPPKSSEGQMNGFSKHNHAKNGFLKPAQPQQKVRESLTTHTQGQGVAATPPAPSPRLSRCTHTCSSLGAAAAQPGPWPRSAPQLAAFRAAIGECAGERAGERGPVPRHGQLGRVLGCDDDAAPHSLTHLGRRVASRAQLAAPHAGHGRHQRHAIPAALWGPAGAGRPADHHQQHPQQPTEPAPAHGHAVECNPE